MEIKNDSIRFVDHRELIAVFPSSSKNAIAGSTFVPLKVSTHLVLVLAKAHQNTTYKTSYLKLLICVPMASQA
jgi:hypothetical protein